MSLATHSRRAETPTAIGGFAAGVSDQTTMSKTIISRARRFVTAHGREIAVHAAFNSLLIAAGYVYGSVTR